MSRRTALLLLAAVPVAWGGAFTSTYAVLVVRGTK